jgi:thymidylate kinase
LVLIDRYYYDFLVDQRRYRLNVPDWLVRFGLCLIRQPDLVFLLDAPPEVLLTRKQELTFDETSRQREAYLRVAQSLPNAIVVDAMQPPAQVASDMAKAILEHLSLRAGA